MSRKEQLATLMGRTGLLRLVPRLRPGRLVVLCYHRIRPYDDAFTTAFDPEVFGPTASELDRQIAWLRDNARVLGQDELIERARAGAAPREACVAITFDDGYRDNFTLALPVLERHGVPATFFIPTTIIERRELGWWDIVAYLLKRTTKATVSFWGESFEVGQDRGKVVTGFDRRMVKEPAARILEQTIGRPVRLLAYPFGGLEQFTDDTARLARECGYDLAFSFDSSSRGYSRLGAIEPFRVNRLEVPTSLRLLHASTLAPEVFAR